MARANFKTIFYKLFVFGKYRSFYNSIAPISVIIKKRVAYVLHVYPNLVRTAGLQSAFYKRYIIESFQHFIVCDGFFAIFSIRIRSEQFSESLMAAHMCYDGSFFFFKIAPNQCYVPAMYGVVKKLFGKMRHCLWCFCHYQKP